METLGRKIKLLRHQNNWNQQEVAKQLGISIPAYSKIETGITDVNLSRLEQIAKLYNTSIAELFSANDSNKINELQQKISEQQKDILELQKRLINLYDKN